LIFDESYFELMDQVKRLNHSIHQSELYQAYLSTKRMMNASVEVQKQKQAFLFAKEKFETIKEYGTFVPDYRLLQKEMLAEKRKLDQIQEVVAFRQSERALQGLLDGIALKLAQTVSKEILVESGNPLAPSGKKHHHCGG
jgi:cell fate (sporulation/competence/biofilm development) regulator YlbF (YheA/YmcA/DUF963 family)